MNNEKYIHEMYLATLERTIRRLWILCIVTIVLLVGANIAWIYYENQFEDVTQTVTQEATADGESDIRLENSNGR